MSDMLTAEQLSGHVDSTAQLRQSCMIQVRENMQSHAVLPTSARHTCTEGIARHPAQGCHCRFGPMELMPRTQSILSVTDHFP